MATVAAAAASRTARIASRAPSSWVRNGSRSSKSWPATSCKAARWVAQTQRHAQWQQPHSRRFTTTATTFSSSISSTAMATTRFTTLSVTRLAPRASYHNFANRLTRAASRRRGRVLHGTIVARSALRQASGARRAASGTASAPASASTAAGAAHKTVSAASGSGSGAGSNASNARSATGLKAWWAEYGEKAKRMFRTYGAVGFVWYFGLYFFTWVSVCVCVCVGLEFVIDTSPHHLRAYVCVWCIVTPGLLLVCCSFQVDQGPQRLQVAQQQPVCPEAHRRQACAPEPHRGGGWHGLAGKPHTQAFLCVDCQHCSLHLPTLLATYS